MNKCWVCRRRLKPGRDFPRKPTVIEGVQFDGKTPFLCWKAKECLARVGMKNGD